MNVRETTIGALLIALSGFTFYATKDFPPFRVRGVTLPGPSFFPRFVAMALFCCGIIELMQAYRQNRSAEEQGDQPGFLQVISNFIHSPGMGAITISIISIVMYVLLLEKIGFQIMTVAFLATMMLCFHVRPGKAVVYSVIVVMVIVALFERLFQVPLPYGIFHL